MPLQIRKLDLSKKELKELDKRIRLTKERKIADRLRVIKYKADGLKHEDIAYLLNIGINQVTEYLQRYQQGGIEAVCQSYYKVKQPCLSCDELNQLKIELRTNIYNTAAEVVAWVEEKFQITYTISGMNKLLKRLKFTYKKNRLVPSKANPELQRQFVAWFKKIRDSLEEDDRIYFVDAMHAKHNAEAGYAWSEIGKPHLIPSNSGRKRYNILGAYCTGTHENLFILTDENINQDKIIDLLNMLHSKHFKGKIYVVLDNAPYQRANRVQFHAKLVGVTLKYQPSYSPNLNLIERLWKLTRKITFKDKYRATFEEFKSILHKFFNDLEVYKTELTSLMTESFEKLPSNW